MIRVKAKATGNLFIKSQQIINEEMNRAMAKAVIRLEGEVSNETPVGVTGFLRTGIRGNIVSPVPMYRGIVGVVGAAVKYAQIVEVGREPGRMPPDAPIRRWIKITDKGRAFMADVAQAHGIKNKKRALDSATWLKRKGIAERGTRGAFMFEKAEKKLRGYVISLFEQAKNIIEKRLSDK
jgi:hypothetical protein